MKKVIFIIIFIMFFLSYDLVEADITKTIVVIMDEMKINDAQEIFGNNKYSIGLMNIKSENYLMEDNIESKILTISMGKRINIENVEINTLKTRNKYKIENYNYIKKQMKDKHVVFSQEINNLGEKLTEDNIRIGAIGNKELLLLICDDKGYYDFGIIKSLYKIQKPNKLISDFFVNKGEVLFVSSNRDNIKDLKLMVQEHKDKNIIIFPINTDISSKRKLNYTLVPIIIRHDEVSGVITSKTTKREGVINSLDIYTTLLSIYNIENNSLGNTIEVIPKDKINITNYIENIYSKYITLNIIKYLYHGLLIIFQIIFFMSYLIKKINKLTNYIPSLILYMFASSFILAIFIDYINMYIYNLLMILSIIILFIINKKIKINIFIIFFINIFILTSIYFDSDMIYNSYIGYNNILAGGRYYGLNNEIMGVLLSTSIIICFKLRNIFNDKLSIILISIYLLIIITSFTGVYGANFGGFITTIFMIFLIYNSFINHKKWTIKSVIIFLISSITFNFILDLSLDYGSHLSKLFYQTKTLGFLNFISIIREKVNQMIFFISTPPWSIIWIFNIIFSIYIWNKQSISRLSKVLLITSIIALIFNDTGIISFVYMNSFFMLNYQNKIKIPKD